MMLLLLLLLLSQTTCATKIIRKESNNEPVLFWSGCWEDSAAQCLPDNETFSWTVAQLNMALTCYDGICRPSKMPATTTELYLCKPRVSVL